METPILMLLLSVSVLVSVAVDDDAADVSLSADEELLLDDPQPAKRPPTIVTQSNALTNFLKNLFLIKTSFSYKLYCTEYNFFSESSSLFAYILMPL
jgi:hypothetical protein